MRTNQPNNNENCITGSEKPSGRIVAIDASRGAAMLFVFLAHFSFVYLMGPAPGQMELVAKASLIACPMFMIISGVTLGYLYRANANQFQRIQTKLIDRGLFLLTIGHGQS